MKSETVEHFEVYVLVLRVYIFRYIIAFSKYMIVSDIGSKLQYTLSSAEAAVCVTNIDD